MRYQLLYTDKAVGQLAGLPTDLLDAVEGQLARLAEAPTGVSVPVAFPPFPPRGQLFHFQVADSAGVHWFVTVIFRYSQDESGLHVLSVTWRELPDD